MCVCTQELTLCVPCLAVRELGLDSNTCLCIGGVCEGVTSLSWYVLQGGGVYINGGTVSFTDTQIYSNTATVSLWPTLAGGLCGMWEQLVCVRVCTQELTLCVPCLAGRELGLDSNTCLCIGGVCGMWEQLVCVCVHAGADAVCALFGST